ncbi:MAG: DUF554 domain-containing protein [Tissierellia bacterium]|nr:DUF554 domain-containing protein [Tissierellia bacterium]
MLGSIVNAVSIVLGSVLGILINKGIKEEYKKIVMDAVGLTVVIMGITSAIKSENLILVIISMVLGSIIGQAIGIQDKLDKLGNRLEERFGKEESNFSKGFVTASLVYCIGAMAIIGSLESGITGDHSTLFAKSVLDGITAVIFASTLGIGVAFSAASVLIYEGSISILASYLSNLMSDPAITEMSAVGGILITAIGLNVLGIKKVNAGNMLPAVFIPLVYFALKTIFGI